MILVTGGTGFVGPAVVHALRTEGHGVRALARDLRSKQARTLESWGCTLAQGDMTDSASLERAVQGCDTIVHLVAIPTGSEEKFQRVMIQGTRDLVDAAKNAGVGRFVHMSALGTGERSKDVTPYFRAKWDQEQTVKGSGIDHTIFRPSFIFGKSGGMLPLLVKQVRWSPAVAVVGTKRMQPIWVEDVAAYFTKSLSIPGSTNRTFELGGPDVVTWDELYDRIKRVTGKRRPTFRLPVGVARAGAAVVEKLPTGLPLSRDAVTMLEFEDNVTDTKPAVETFGIQPIGLTEQIRRAVA
jgi:NADH dehydrogenase